MAFPLIAGGRIGEFVTLVLAAPTQAALPAPEPVVVATAARCPVPSAANAARFLTEYGVAQPSGGKVFVQLGAGPGLKNGEIERAADGLFYLTAMVNGTSVRFLVDTGASTIVLTRSDAARAGVLPSDEAFQATAETAAGKTSMARVRLAHLAAGPAERRNVDAAIAGEGLGVSLLGQSWLSQLESVTIAGDRMVLR